MAILVSNHCYYTFCRRELSKPGKKGVTLEMLCSFFSQLDMLRLLIGVSPLSPDYEVSGLTAFF